ncbi:tRNA pseudouridine(13) synthase TruD [Coralloluteibacterium stylophorae]|uniref:tRNA pseudouridine synthase D n=1 Tax=Coralloluteibacterium stylophorae TaxID=1776034 RepID=A0A8J7VT07_9GAMM|nr:tRNA pseudouridine(13) synthase TruD [Coralloluteibacterium stylophorae]MBS7456440.1 tRNA pseudouridine(13) synthase TruD [Coralloluteibacterium stylophorae]
MSAVPRAFGADVLGARIRCTPEDFRVDEVDAFAATGEGEHLLLTIEKRGMTTAFAAKRIAQWAGVGEVAIGYAGLKDRHAVTRQRISVHLPKRVAPELAALEAEDLRVVEATWHNRKLPRGALAGNRFSLLLREVRGERATVDARLAEIARRGAPNAFGEQRFGREAGNLAQALRMFAGARVKREQRGILLSAARSALFNRVLAARVADGSWDRGLAGEVWMLDGSHSVFGPEDPDAALAARAAALDIHPTGVLWGRGEPRPVAAARALEEAVLADEEALALRAGLEAAGLRQERRALRMRVTDLCGEWVEEGLRIGFALPPGAYATTVLAQLGAVEDAARA